MNIQRLLEDYGVPYMTEGNKHCTEGWINIHCPFCAGSQDYHLGIHESGKAAHCWRCGIHSLVDILCKILNISRNEAIGLIRKYRIRAAAVGVQKAKETVSIYPFRLPKPHDTLSRPYKKYLENRRFNPDIIAENWDLLQTGPSSFLDGISYSHRLLIPIYWNKEMVSFQARDISGISPRKYMACPKRREIKHHKDILYGRQEYWENESGIIVVEGVTDVWRLGVYAAATLGIEFKMEQVLELAKGVKGRIFIVFDEEQQAQKQAGILATKLKALSKKVFIESIGKGDPADMSQADADYFVKQLLGRREKHAITKSKSY